MAFTMDDALAFLKRLAPFAARLNYQIQDMQPGALKVRIPKNAELGRDIGIFCGQAVMTAADSLGPICVASAAGEYRDMTTVDFSCHFLRALPVEDIDVEVSLIKGGRQISVVRVDFRAAGQTRLSAFATVTYMYLPSHG